VYHYLIACENLRYGKKTVVVADQNELDGHTKVKAVIANYIFRFDAANGGQLVEFDSREKCFNWQNTLTRRKEAYHQRVFENQPAQKEVPSEDGIDTIHQAAMPIDESLRDVIIYDWYLKNSFIDHISDNHFCYENFRYSNFPEYGDFANQPFEVTYDKKGATFVREGGLYFPQKEDARLEKSFYPTSSGFDFEIAFTTHAEGYFNYILEHNFHFSDYESITVNNSKIEGDRRFHQTNKLEIFDGHLNKSIIITLDHPCDITYFPLETLSQSEHGFDLTVQGLSFAMAIRFSKQLMIKGSLEVYDV